MFSTRKPYLILPKLVEQPTWGGDYIVKLKQWDSHSELNTKKIGQSYELFSSSKLLLNINDSTSDLFSPDVGNADTSYVTNSAILKENEDYLLFEKCGAQAPLEFLGPQPPTKPAPLLIKINHAFGNSFQLHIKPNQESTRWKPKAESWFFLEDGLITCGIKPTADMEAYKKACLEIEKEMKYLSQQVENREISLTDANKKAQAYIHEKNPWQFVNIHQVKKDLLVDLSAGGLHHSWEENREVLPLGNVIYEVQQDVMDPVCTIRSFDQGKIKSDGTVREIQIEDYFTYLDTTPEHNDINNLIKKQTGRKLLSTDNYSLDIVELVQETPIMTDDSYNHIFVKNGAVTIKAPDGSVHVTQGHSCLIPYNVHTYTVTPENGVATLLKTYIE
jgi:mannose-6-phosphate isomerase class I